MEVAPPLSIDALAFTTNDRAADAVAFEMHGDVTVGLEVLDSGGGVFAVDRYGVIVFENKPYGCSRGSAFVAYRSKPTDRLIGKSLP